MGVADQSEPVGAALLGLRVTRPSYVKLTELDERTTTRDLGNAAELCVLEARGEPNLSPLTRVDQVRSPRRFTALGQRLSPFGLACPGYVDSRERA